MKNVFEKELYTYTVERLAKYRRWLEHEYHMDTSDDALRMQLHSTYWVEDMFPLLYNSSKYKLNYVDTDDVVVLRSAAVLKLYRVLLELRKLTVNGWNLSVAHKVIDDISHSVFNSNIV